VDIRSLTNNQGTQELIDMPETGVIREHYTHGNLIDAIRDGLDKLGKSVEQVRIDDLAPVDEFHIGGRIATASFLDQLDITPEHRVLDVGCGLGGGSRFAADMYGCQVTGVDLTPEYIETGNILCEWVGLDSRVCLRVEDATNLSQDDDSFDRAYVMHVGMNISDKHALAAELHRVIRPGGKAGIYDVMRVSAGELQFPVPWATESSASSVSTPEVYRSALESAGFKVVAERNRRDFALKFFEELLARAPAGSEAPPLGLHILMGDAAPRKVKNMIDNISRNLVAPIELVAEKTF
jgi:SAM-dependent methyltransferase